MRDAEDGFRFSVPGDFPAKEMPVEDVERMLLERLEKERDAPEEAMWQLARFYAAVRQTDKATALVTKLASRTSTPGAAAFYLVSMGQICERANDHELAIDYYRQALAHEPSDADTWYFAHNNLGYCLNQIGQHEEAERTCRRAIEIDPGRHNAYKNLGITLQAQGRYADAARAFIEALRAEAGDPRALRHLEELISRHPELQSEIDDLDEELQRCRKAIEVAFRARRKILEQNLRDGTAEEKGDSDA